jgi:hypothetical protein
MTPEKTARYQQWLALCGASDDARAATELEEMDAAVQALGRKLEDIKIDDFASPLGAHMATWDDYDLGCLTGTGATPEQAIWDLIDQTHD